MSTKLHPGNFDCYANAADDEPMFILLARDKDAPAMVRFWAVAREMAIDAGLKPESDRTMVEEAKQCAYQMQRWKAERDHERRQIEHDQQPQMFGRDFLLGDKAPSEDQTK